MFPICLSYQLGRKYKLKGNATAERAPRPGWGQLPTGTTAAPEMEEGCNKGHTDAAAHVQSEGIYSCSKHAKPG